MAKLSEAVLARYNERVSYVTDAYLDGQVKLVQKNVAELTELIAKTAFEALLHAWKHGNVIYCQRLFEACGGNMRADGKGSKSTVRAEALKAWFSKMGPISARTDATTKVQVWNLKKGWSQDDFQLELAEKTPFYEFFPEMPIRIFSLTRWFESFQNITDRVDNLVDKSSKEGKDYFAGDPEMTKAAFTDIIDFSRARMAKLSAQQRGEIGKDGKPIAVPEPVTDAAAQGENLEEQEAPESRLIRNGEEVPNQAVA